MPSTPNFTTSEWGIRRNTVVSESPFTGAQQIISYDKAQWYCSVTLPAMKRSQAAAWHSFFLKLRGRENTFLMGDPDATTPTGSTSDHPASVVTSASAAISDTSLLLTIGAGKKLNAGTYLQTGTASTAKLYMVVDDNTGNGAVTIEPKLKAAVPNLETIIFNDAKGVFRMDGNDLTWSANQISTYGISFSCSEAL